MEAVLILLVGLTVATGLGPAGWLAGLAFAVLGWAALTDGLRRFEARSFTPAGRLTLGRAVLVGGVAALVVETTDPRPDPVMAIVVLSVAVLALTALGGSVAPPTEAFDTRFAMEVGAVFVLVLSAFASTFVGVWVMAIGLLRYVFAGVGRVLPWLRAPLPPSRVRSVVGTAQGVVLTAVATGVLPTSVAVVLAGLALLALIGSFAQDVRWLAQNRTAEPAAEKAGELNRRRVAGWVFTGLAGLLVLVALVGPNQLGQLSLWAFTRIPVEGLMGAALVLVLPVRARRVAIVLIGTGLGLLTIVKFLDMGFYEVFDRPFHPVFDWPFLVPAVDFVETSYGHVGAVLAVVGVALLVLALLVGMTLAVRRLTRVAVGHRTAATRILATLGVLWLVCALAGVRFAPEQPVAARSAADHVYDDVRQVRQGLVDDETFSAEVAKDDYRYTPGKDLLTALRGKDVMFVFVESYGRVAIERSEGAAQIDKILDDGTERLRAAGFDSRSAFLTSPTFGGGSWLAHATFQTGLWVDNQQRRDSLNRRDRTTLSIAFNRAGWRTVGVVPANTEDWPDGNMYHFDKVYDSRNVGYRGPRFSYATVPDQYTLEQFERTERAPNPEPIMAQINLISSHTPFTPIPEIVGWDEVGDGSIYDPMAAAGTQPGDVWPDPTKVRGVYTDSIAYSLKSLLSYVETYGDDDLVLVFLGDHQPAPIVASQEGSRDVPISIVTRDQAVMNRIDGWGWQNGINPAPDAPEWKMDTFRDRFLDAYGPKSDTDKSAAPHR
ncbi:sulfatase-like hydrolase/transferase [Actinophytocola sp.]|uniref:sulfatase-like hydrolase/transferase n=1 Tax=Actinophytocola sp. TaxID=1872138 RepID=UPI002ED21389